MSMFRSAADISSSDSQSSSDESEQDVVANSSYHHVRNTTQTSAKGTTTPPVIAETGKEAYRGSPRRHEVSDLKDLPDVASGSHANMMTAALLEFYCLSRAADILNAQEGSHRAFTRDSPEVQYLGRKMYSYKSQFLSSHGVLAGGVDKEEMGTTRQYYRDNLDLLGASALEKLELDDRHVSQSSISATRDLTLAPRSSRAVQFLADTAYTGPEQRSSQRGGMLGLKRISSGRNINSLEDIRLDVSRLPNRALPFSGSSPVSFPLFSSQPPSPVNSLSRYSAEFSEIGILGRGSYGEVYHAQNHIDGQSYAVKKIPLKQNRLEQLQFGGHNQLEAIMKEIRTLARLEHPNVVRYYGAWVEKVHSSGHLPSSRSTPFELDQERTKSTLLSHGSMENQNYGIVFEHSESSATQTSTDSASIEYEASFSEASQQNSQSTATSRQSRRTLSNGVETDEDTESISRGFSASNGQLSTSGGTDGDIFTDGLSNDPSKMQVQRRPRDGSGIPAVVLHIQMSLHPLSLGSYLNPQSSEKGKDGCSFSRRHCYHLVPSLRLMLSIISGVEYIHSKGIVHRDLKPANIFLSSSENSNSVMCHTCQIQLESGRRYCHPRIGDFGLVADISHLNKSPTKSSQDIPNASQIVGTEFYRPPLNNSDVENPEQSDNPTSDETFYAVDERLDVYALGVILFELLYRLNTKMERQLVLGQLTRDTSSSPTIFPSDFSKKVDMGQLILDDGTTVAQSLMDCMQGMLDLHSRQRWPCSRVKEHLEGILAALEKAPRA